MADISDPPNWIKWNSKENFSQNILGLIIFGFEIIYQPVADVSDYQNVIKLQREMSSEVFLA